MFNFIKKFFTQKKPDSTVADEKLRYMTDRLIDNPVIIHDLNSKLAKNILPTSPEELAKGLNFKEEEEDDLSAINFKSLPKDLRVEIKDLVAKRTKTIIE